jgi:N-acetyl-beta-hexosaminidase
LQALRLTGDRIVELVGLSGGANIMVHAAATGVKTGQVTVKPVFDVEDVLRSSGVKIAANFAPSSTVAAAYMSVMVFTTAAGSGFGQVAARAMPGRIRTRKANGIVGAYRFHRVGSGVDLAK